MFYLQLVNQNLFSQEYEVSFGIYHRCAYRLLVPKDEGETLDETEKIYRCEILMPESLSEGPRYLDHTVRIGLHPLIQPLNIRQTQYLNGQISLAQCMRLVASVMSNSLRPYGLQPVRLLCPWGFFRQGYWSGLLCPAPGDLPNPGIKPVSLKSPALAGGFYTSSATWEAPCQEPSPGIMQQSTQTT